MSLFVELKRRKVLRTTLGYLAAAFVAEQALQLFTKVLHLPRWILTSYIILVIVALPMVIGLAWAFDITPVGVEHTSSAQVKVQWKRVGIPAIVSGMLLFLAFGFYTLNRSEEAINNSLIAVLPFHVSGDPAIAYLGDGMVDLLATKLTGENGARAADPRVVFGAMKNAGTDNIDDEDAKALAHSIGAAQVLQGTITGTAQNMAVHAQLTRASGDNIAADVTTSADSISRAVDELVAKLLDSQANQGRPLEALTTASPAALRLYLAGQAQYRAGNVGQANALFARAVDADTTFALAALYQRMTSRRGENPQIDTGKITRTLRNNLVRLAPTERARAMTALE